MDQVYIGLQSQYERGSRKVKGFNFYFEDLETPIATQLQSYEYDLNNLEHGKTYNVGVSKVYSTGESEIYKASFTYRVVENVAPVILSEPVLQAQILKEYRYKLEATDYNDDDLNFTLLEAPEDFELIQEGNDYYIIGYPQQLGTETISWEVSDGALPTTQTYELSVQEKVFLDEVTSGSISIFPNPASGFFSIMNQAGTMMEVVNTEGQVLMMQRISSENEYVEIDLPAGNYMLKIKDENGTRVEKLIIQ